MDARLGFTAVTTRTAVPLIGKPVCYRMIYRDPPWRRTAPQARLIVSCRITTERGQGRGLAKTHHLRDRA
jgi:hypothetical protein